MKKIIILLALIVNLNIFSQNSEYAFLINITSYSNPEATEIEITIEGSNYIFDHISTVGPNESEFYFITLDNNEVNQNIEMSYYVEGPSTCQNSQTFSFNSIFDFIHGSYSTIYGGAIYGGGCDGVTFAIFPIHIANGNQTVCSTERISLYNGFHWQYSLLENPDRNNPNDWIDLSDLQDGRNIASISLPDLLGNNNPRFIYFRAGYKREPNTGGYGSGWTNMVQYTLQNPPPILYDDPNTSGVDGIEVIQPDCYGGNTTFNFTFDRALNPGETFSDCGLSGNNGLYIPCDITQATPFETTINGNTYYRYTCSITITETNYYTFDYSTETNDIPSCSGGHYDFLITVPTQVNFTATNIQNVSCNGGDDGQIEITANGGTGKYQYSLDDGTTWIDFDNINSYPDDFNSLVTQTIDDNLKAGSYRIKVRDVNLTDNNIHCTGYVRDTSVSPQVITTDYYIDITISQPAEFSASITGYDFTCPEDDETSIVIENVSGGTQTYKYKYKSTNDTHWLPSDTTWYNISNPNLTNISISASGTYIVQVTDDNECSIIESTITINKSDEISLNYNVINPSCYDASDGSISGTISGGTLGNDYTFTIDYRDENNVGNTTTTNSDGTFTISNLPNGTYTLTVSNVSNCSKTFDNIKLNQTQVEYSLEKIKDVSCYNGNDGEIKIVANGGTGQYQYSTDNGSTWTSFDNNPSDPNPSDSITQLVFLSEGNYTVLVKDLSNCSGTLISGEDPVTITAPQSIEINNLTVIDVSSSGSTDGSFSLNVSKGTPGYEYELIKDNNSIDQGNIDYNNSTGTYDLSIDNLDEGTYQLIITDANGCNYIDPDTDQNYKEIIIGVIQDLSISLQKTNIDCYGYNNGSLTAEVTGGVQPYSYEWQKEEAGTWQTLSQTGNSISNLSPGNYKCIVSCDYHGTILTAEATELIEEPAEVTFDVSKHDISCPDGNDGYITIEATGGSGEYQYNTNDGTGWHEFTNNPTTPNPSNTVTEQISLVAGVYTIEVKDLNACEGVNTNNNTQIDITEPNPFVFDIISQQDPTAHNINDGQIVISVTGGTTDTGQYQFGYQNVTLYDQNGDSYSLSGADLTGSPVQFTFNQLPGGNYYLYVKDANNCEADSYNTNNINDYIHLTQPGQLSVNIELVTPIDCHGNNTGAIKAIGDGGIVLDPNDNNGLPYHYNWQKQVAGTWQDLGIDDMIISDLEAATYKVIITDANGITAEAQYLLTEPDEIILNMSATQISCDSGRDGTATVNITGGTPPYQIEWRNTNQTIIDTTKTIENLIAGTYTVTVTDTLLCSATAEITLQQPGDMEVYKIQQDPTCYGYNDGSIEVSVSGGQPPYTYIWAVNTTHDSPLLENLTAGTYDLSIIDANKCKAEVVIVLKEPEPLMIELGPDITLCSNQSVDFDISIDDPNAVYSWESDNGFASQSPTVHITDAGTYTATITYSAGCISSDQITISTSNEVVVADFLVTSQAFAGEDIILINTSNPMGDQTEWEVPTGVQIVEQNNETITLHFDNPGLYDISLISYQGDCIAVETKTIIVNEARDLPQVESDGNKFIQKFKVYPNPSNGNFKVKVELEKTADISLRLFSLTSNVPIDDQIKHGKKEYEMNYTVNKPAGTYFLLLETNGKREIRKIVIE